MDQPLMKMPARVAYFSMEIGLNPLMPTYAGGLGVLAGDTIRSAADLAVPMVGVTLLHRRGYFYQRLDQKGWQSEEPVAWSVGDFAEPLDQQVSVEIDAEPCRFVPGAIKSKACRDIPSRCIYSTRRWPRTVHGIRRSLIRSMAAICIIAYARKWCWGSAGSRSCVRWGMGKSFAIISTKGMRHCWSWP